VVDVAQITVAHNNGLQLTRSARCALRPTDRGQSLRAALAAEAECSADLGYGEWLWQAGARA
jgi:hypothetical protein